MTKLLLVSLAFFALPSAAASSETIRYLYDAKGRLVKTYRETGPAAGALVVTAHDRADNRTRYTVKNVVRVLGPDQFIQSADGRSKLHMQSDGNLLLYQGYQVLWVAPGIYGSTNTAIVQDDGKFVVYGPSGPLWTTGIHAPDAEIRCKMTAISLYPRWTGMSFGTPAPEGIDANEPLPTVQCATANR